ncbi:MAG: DUF4363 family protein [Clostridiales bacterium]|nr:DUF4363 family protein [Clostridiales bacterium]
MRTSLVISLVLLMLVIGIGVWEEKQTEVLCGRYVSAAKELRIMAEKVDWLRAEETISAYKADWEDTTPWLQVLINHDDIDDVTLALTRLEAAVAAKEQGQCYEICAELEENARHIHHRDNFTLGNVL